jgi:hypothetical protein
MQRLCIALVGSKLDCASTVWNSIMSTDANKLECIPMFAALRLNIFFPKVHYLQYTVTVSVSVQQYTLYYPSTPSLHVSALLGRLQVMINVLDCDTVRCVYINIFFFILTHVIIVYIKVFRNVLKC